MPRVTHCGGLTTQGGAGVSLAFSNSTSTGNQLVQVNGPVTLNGTTTVSIYDINGSLASGNYPLFAYTGALGFWSSPRRSSWQTPEPR